jgi:Na+/H+ antiporter NhaC
MPEFMILMHCFISILTISVVAFYKIKFNSTSNNIIEKREHKNQKETQIDFLLNILLILFLSSSLFLSVRSIQNYSDNPKNIVQLVNSFENLVNK